MLGALNTQPLPAEPQAMENPHVLIIEDEESILELVRYNLNREGYRVSTATSGETGLKLATSGDVPNLVVLDLMLPGVDGLDVCCRLKGDPRTKNIPVVMMSARGEESDVVRGLELGADDYITKPFSPKVLLARVNAVLRRQNEGPVQANATLEIHGISIDPVRFVVKAGSETVALTATEFRLLHFLCRHPGWVFTRYQIVDAVKGEDYAVTERAVDVQVVGLRRKLGDYGKLVETVRGVGYRFKE